ncbi:MAG: DUF262 domain-containing protein [Dehalococcoidia bacterium]
MKANATSLLGIFENKMQIEVPLFQRQYVWEQERHWEPLWEDVSRKFTEYLEGRRDAPIHFLGAMVLDQKMVPVTHVQRRQVIDGQQRLTTLQVFLASLRDFCRERGCEELGNECDGFTLNRGMMVDPDVDRFKVWPTQADRAQFVDVMTSASREELERRHPLVRQKYARKPDPRPRMVEAYLYFHDQLTEYFLGSDDDPPLFAEAPLAARLDECFQALKNAIQVVAIDLEEDDDTQVIFETLNARGEPLLPADLLRNYIFLRARRFGEPQEPLYQEFWSPFDSDFWRIQARQGRLNRPRSDLFIQHFLASRQGRDVPIAHLFVEYRHWIERSNPFGSVRSELETLARQRDDFREIIAPTKASPLHGLAQFLDAFDVRTAYPLLLAMLDRRPADDDIQEIARVLESYLLRRAVLGMTTKNYSRLFLQLTRSLQRDGFRAYVLAGELLKLDGPSTAWPDDQVFAHAWMTQHIYHVLNNPKLVLILSRLSQTYEDNKSGSVTVEGNLSVEHLLPQSWIEHWPLPDGSHGMTPTEVAQSPDDPRAESTARRNEVLHTLGNLTILPPGANSWVSNASWEEKRPKILQKALLPINPGALFDEEHWDESSIERRGRELLERALQLWPRGEAPPAGPTFIGGVNR